MKDDKKDIGFYDDAIFTLSNLIALENHSMNTFNQTQNEKYLKIAKIVREMRSPILYKLTKANEGELYCMGKHSLASSIGLKELSARKMEENRNVWAKELIEMSVVCENLFKYLNDVINADTEENIKEVEDEYISEEDNAPKTKSKLVKRMQN